MPYVTPSDDKIGKLNEKVSRGRQRLRLSRDENHRERSHLRGSDGPARAPRRHSNRGCMQPGGDPKRRSGTDDNGRLRGAHHRRCRRSGNERHGEPWSGAGRCRRDHRLRVFRGRRCARRGRRSSGPACGSMASIARSCRSTAPTARRRRSHRWGRGSKRRRRPAPISAANATFLATASSNPDVSTATSATGLEWQAVTVKLYPSGTPLARRTSCSTPSATATATRRMASMAYVNPPLVESVITDNGDGTFDDRDVRPDGQADHAWPSTPRSSWTPGTRAASGQVSANDGSADWATILEKAVMKYDYAYGMVGQIDGIGSEELIPMFTGTGVSVAISPGSLTPAQFQQVVTVSLAAGRVHHRRVQSGPRRSGRIRRSRRTGTRSWSRPIPSTDMTDMRNPWGVNPWADAERERLRHEHRRPAPDPALDDAGRLAADRRPAHHRSGRPVHRRLHAVRAAGEESARPIHIREPHARRVP